MLGTEGEQGGPPGGGVGAGLHGCTGAGLRDEREVCAQWLEWLSPLALQEWSWPGTPSPHGIPAYRVIRGAALT